MSQDLTFSLDATRGECVLELDDACGGGQSFEVTEVVLVGGSEDEKVYFYKIDLRIASDCIDFDLLGVIFSWGEGGLGMPLDPPRFFSFSFESICMLEIGLKHFLEGGRES